MDKTKKTRKNRKANNPIRQEAATLTLSALTARLRSLLEDKCTEQFDNTEEGILLEVLECQTTAIDHIIYDLRECISSSLPYVVAIARAEGLTKTIRNSLSLPPELKNTGYDTAYLSQIHAQYLSKENSAKVDLPPEEEEAQALEKANREYAAKIRRE